MTDAHLLDRPIWSALTTRQAPLAEIDGPARRYPADIAPFADVADFSAESFVALHALMGADQPAALFTARSRRAVRPARDRHGRDRRADDRPAVHAHGRGA